MFIYNLPICVQQFFENTRNLFVNKHDVSTKSGAWGSVVVKALRY